MFMYCDECSYDSGDWDCLENLTNAVGDDGGIFTLDKTGKPDEIVCPNGHFGEHIHLDLD